jgi:hypothetical protein
VAAGSIAALICFTYLRYNLPLIFASIVASRGTHEARSLYEPALSESTGSPRVRARSTMGLFKGAPYGTARRRIAERRRRDLRR